VSPQLQNRVGAYGLQTAGLFVAVNFVLLPADRSNCRGSQGHCGIFCMHN